MKNAARTIELCATFVTGLGVLGLLQPRSHVELWKDAPLGLAGRVAPSVGNPARRRREAAAQLAGGVATLFLLHAWLRASGRTGNGAPAGPVAGRNPSKAA